MGFFAQVKGEHKRPAEEKKDQNSIINKMPSFLRLGVPNQLMRDLH